MKNNNYKYIIPAFISSFVIVVLFSGLVSSKNFSEQPEVSYLNIEGLKDIDGNYISFDSNFVVHFFATWCSYCKLDVDKFSNYKTPLKGKIVAVSLTDTNETLKNWLNKTNNYNDFYKISIPSGDSDLRKLNIKSYPQTFVIGKDGKVLYHARGELSNKIIEDEIIPKLSVFYRYDRQEPQK